MTEVELHADKQSAWFVRNGKVCSCPKNLSLLQWQMP